MKAPPRWCLKKYLCYFHPSFGEEFHFVRILFYNWVETNAYKSYFNEIFCSRWMRSTPTSLGKQVVGPPIAVFRVVSLRLKFNNMRLRWSRLKPVWGVSVDGWPPMWWFSTFHDFWRESAWSFLKSSEKKSWDVLFRDCVCMWSQTTLRWIRIVALFENAFCQKNLLVYTPNPEPSPCAYIDIEYSTHCTEHGTGVKCQTFWICIYTINSIVWSYLNLVRESSQDAATLLSL